MATRRAQAMVELALGMFALALVVSVLCTFAVYISRSLRVQNSTRSTRVESSAPVETDPFFADILGVKSIQIRDRAVIPLRNITN